MTSFVHLREEHRCSLTSRSSSASCSSSAASAATTSRCINILRSMHGGKDYTPEWGVRQRGRGPYADQIAARFHLAVKRLGLNERNSRLRTDLFRRPGPAGCQLSLL